jgi:phosphohistidine phosphatase
MKYLLFFRHGKSDWDADYGDDHERPLARRGRKAAQKMGQYLSETGTIPDRILSSTAVRAYTTVELAMEAGGWEADVTQTRKLYHASPSTLLDIIRATSDDIQILMLVGHEPTWSETIEGFIGGGAVQFPTAAMACIELEISNWNHAAFGKGLLKWLVIPKMLD